MRAFVAIDLADDVRAALAREQARLKAACAHNRDIRWTRPEGLHLTLKFLGAVERERAASVIAALQALDPFDAFKAEVMGFGFFPDARRPRVLWVGLEAPAALSELAARVETALENLGFARENRPFKPHLTLARFDRPHAPPALTAAVAGSSAGSFGCFEVSEFFLLESRLRPGGAEYFKLARFPVSQRT
jgi:RNA 2',3'-cyclic 3'-phosphodiesterase